MGARPPWIPLSTPGALPSPLSPPTPHQEIPEGSPFPPGFFAPHRPRGPLRLQALRVQAALPWRQRAFPPLCAHSKLPPRRQRMRDDVGIATARQRACACARCPSGASRAVITPRPEEEAAVPKSSCSPHCCSAAGQPRGSERRLRFCKWLFWGRPEGVPSAGAASRPALAPRGLCGTQGFCWTAGCSLCLLPSQGYLVAPPHAPILTPRLPYLCPPRPRPPVPVSDPYNTLSSPMSLCFVTYLERKRRRYLRERAVVEMLHDPTFIPQNSDPNSSPNQGHDPERVRRTPSMWHMCTRSAPGEYGGT